MLVSKMGYLLLCRMLLLVSTVQAFLPPSPFMLPGFGVTGQMRHPGSPPVSFTRGCRVDRQQPGQAMGELTVKEQVGSLDVSLTRECRFDRKQQGMTLQMAHGESRRHLPRKIFRAVNTWLPYMLNVAIGASALVGLGSTGVAGLSAAAGWKLAKVHTLVTFGFTSFSAVHLGLFSGDGTQTTSLVGGVPAPSYSRAALAVQHVATSMAEDPEFAGDDERRMLVEYPPKAYIIKTDEPNAFAAGRNQHTVIAVSEGLLRRLDEQELRAVVAHELGHIRNEDIGHHMQHAAIAAGFSGALDYGWQLVKSEMRTERKDDKKKDKDEGSLVIPGLALMAVGAAQYALGTLLRLSASRKDEFAADAVAARMPGGAQALARALQKIEKAAEVERVQRDALGQLHNALATLYIANSHKHDALSTWSDWLGTHPTTERRIQYLSEIAASKGEVFRLL